MGAEGRLARCAQRAIAAAGTDANQFSDFFQQIREVFGIDGEAVTARSGPTLAGRFIGSHLRGGRAVLFHAGIGQDVARHPGVAKDKGILAFVQFGKRFRGGCRYIHGVATGLQDGLQSQSRCKIAVHQKDSG